MKVYVPAAFAIVAFFSCTSLAHAQAQQQQAGGGGTSGGTGSGSGGVGASAAGVGTTSGQTGMGIATLGTSSTGSGKSSSSAGTTIPAASNTFRTTYANPYAIGLSSVSTSFTCSSTGVSGTGFGKPAYAVTSTATQTTALTNTTGVNNEGFNTLSYPKSPPYMTVLGEDLPVIVHAPIDLQQDLLRALERSTFLRDNKSILVAVNGSTVLLKGQVASERERRVVENMVRLTPGVRGVVNELVAPTTKQ